MQFSLSGVSAPFAKILSADLSAKNSKGGLALKGVPSSDSLFDQNTFDGFMNPSYWEEVLGATGTFGADRRMEGLRRLRGRARIRGQGQ